MSTSSAWAPTHRAQRVHTPHSPSYTSVAVGCSAGGRRLVKGRFPDPSACHASAPHEHADRSRSRLRMELTDGPRERGHVASGERGTLAFHLRGVLVTPAT